MSEQWIVTGEDQNGEYGVWSADGTRCLVSATSRHLATITAKYANETNAAELATLKAQRDELLAAVRKIECNTLDANIAMIARAAIANAERSEE